VLLCADKNADRASHLAEDHDRTRPAAAGPALRRLESVARSDPRCCCCCCCCDRSGAESRWVRGRRCREMQPRRPAWPWQAENRTCSASDATAAVGKTPTILRHTETGRTHLTSGQRTIEPGLAARQPHTMKAQVMLHGRNDVPCDNCHAQPLAEHICTMKAACVVWCAVKKHEMHFCVDR
jgi:hypothetical protein